MTPVPSRARSRSPSARMSALGPSIGSPAKNAAWAGPAVAARPASSASRKVRSGGSAHRGVGTGEGSQSYAVPTTPSARDSCAHSASWPRSAASSQPSSAASVVPDAPCDRPVGAQLAAREQAQARAPQKHVADRLRLLEARREGGLGEQVGQLGDDRRRQLRALARDGEHLVGGVPVAARQRGVRRLGHTRRRAAGRRDRPTRRAGSRACGRARRAPRARRGGRRPSSPSAATS